MKNEGALKGGRRLFVKERGGELEVKSCIFHQDNRRGRNQVEELKNVLNLAVLRELG